MENKEKIVGREDLVKDKTTGALLNVDSDGLRAYRARRKQSEKIDDLHERMERLERTLERTEKILEHIANIGTN